MTKNQSKMLARLARPVTILEVYVAVLAGFLVLAFGWGMGEAGYLFLTTRTATAGTAIAATLALPQVIIVYWADRSDELNGQPRNKVARRHAAWVGVIGIAFLVFFAGATAGATIASH